MNIIITGASRGIGFETARILSQDKQSKLLAIARGKEGLEKLAGDPVAEGRIQSLVFDLVTGDYGKFLIPEVNRHFDKIDVLIHNAGALVNKPFELLDEKDFDMVFNTNVKSLFYLVQHLLPHFRENSHIVTVGSMGGFQGSVKFPGLSLYSASKGAVAVLSECMAEEFKDRGIKVNCLALGSAQTEMLAEAFPGYKSPLTAAEMASFIADFALRGQTWFNGKVLPVSISTP
jgi:NAD(P)-dependent dehydrogenase (short-subunit alcohol dehydrogenase family)